ncbi:unnamed protein product [Clonostachys rosea]|uniref:Uncharacterized protein n=1 Tax=Bionectria ochroleuca TaxID=29856 RepID=A0ABY6UP02_BIOOC|nr:unnamed protein product [Clonostachys rosea]
MALTRFGRQSFYLEEQKITVDLTTTDEWQQTGFASWSFGSRPNLISELDRVSLRCLSGRGDMTAACLILDRHEFARLPSAQDGVPVYQAPSRIPVTTLINPSGAKGSRSYPNAIYISFGEDFPGEELRKNWLCFFDKLMDLPPWSFAGFKKRKFLHNNLLAIQDDGLGSADRYDKVLSILYSHGFRPCPSKYLYKPQFRAPVEVPKTTQAPGGAGQTKGTKMASDTGKAAATFKLDGPVVSGARPRGLAMGGSSLRPGVSACAAGTRPDFSNSQSKG